MSTSGQVQGNDVQNTSAGTTSVVQTSVIPADAEHGPTDFLSGIVRVFLESNLSIMLIIFSLLAGVAALLVTPREEDPQIVVPLADVFVQFPRAFGCRSGTADFDAS